MERGLWLGSRPSPKGWLKEAVERVIAGEAVTLNGHQVTDLGLLMGEVALDPRKGGRRLTFRTGYRMVTVVLEEG